MGMNYYLLDKETGDKLHICKISHGWKPLFQMHEGKFSCMAELESYYLASGNTKIIDEYDRDVPFLDLYNKAFTRATDNMNKSHALTKKDGVWEWTDWDFR